jgi:predicted amidophosphoribosyltransferase
VRHLEYLLSSLLELFYPERCALCEATPQEKSWCRTGRAVAGLRAWDRPHLCRDCLTGLVGEPLCGSVCVDGGPPLPIVAANRTSGELVRLVGAWKYHGLRGVVWPLATLVEQAAGALPFDRDEETWLIPVPLHPSRLRSRGFNQAAVLARCLADSGSLQFRDDLLKRVRSTGQQAKVSGQTGRLQNVSEAFRCREAAPAENRARLFLVDDLVTSGATVSAAAAALRLGGWSVDGVLALGMATAATEPG